MLGCTGMIALLAMVPACADRRYEPFAEIRAGLASRHGKQLLDAQELDAALAEFQNAIELNPKLVDAHSGLGSVWEVKGQYEAAARSFAEAVRLDPSSFDNTFSLGRVYQKLARFADAARAYLHACELDPASYKARFNLGICYHQAGALGDAIKTYEQAIALDPSEPGAALNLGAVYDSQEKYYEAIHVYNESLERNPDQPLVLINMAVTMMKQGRIANARKALERAVEIAPEDALAHERLGYCCLVDRSYDVALKHYNKAAAIDSRMAEAYAGRGAVRMALALQQADGAANLRDQAVDDWHRSLELKPDQPKIRKLVEKYQVPKTPEDTLTSMLDASK